jgi:hypothetical protein
MQESERRPWAFEVLGARRAQPHAPEPHEDARAACEGLETKSLGHQLEFARQEQTWRQRIEGENTQ